MTLPFMNWDDVGPDDVVETVVMPDQLGSALQDQSEDHYSQQSADRFPGYVDGTLAGGPLASGPLGVVNKMFGKFVSKVAKADPATIEKPKDLQPLVPGFFDLPLTDFFAPLLNALMGVGGGVLGGALSGIADFFSGKWQQVDDIQDGQTSLNDRVDLLSPLEDYGSCYAPGQGGLLVNGTGVKPFTQQIGPMTGCHTDGSGRIVLEDKGLWEITARMSWSWTVLSGTVAWYVRVLRPDGSVFSQQLDRVNDANEMTRHITTTVVVPDSGYKVEVYVSSSVTGREIFGGPTHNRLIVHHITRSTDFPI